MGSLLEAAGPCVVHSLGKRQWTLAAERDAADKSWCLTSWCWQTVCAGVMWCKQHLERWGFGGGRAHVWCNGSAWQKGLGPAAGGQGNCPSLEQPAIAGAEGC